VELSACAAAADLTLPDDPGGETHVWHQYVVRSPRRDALRAHLKERGINASLHYPIAPHEQPLGLDLGAPPGSLPVAERCARTVLSLPIAPELTDAQIGLVIAAVREFHGRSGA
jgi:dTDP-4-amino-4,6-dideoxygalactose transaminase